MLPVSKCLSGEPCIIADKDRVRIGEVGFWAKNSVENKHFEIAEKHLVARGTSFSAAAKVKIDTQQINAPISTTKVL